MGDITGNGADPVLVNRIATTTPRDFILNIIREEGAKVGLTPEAVLSHCRKRHYSLARRAAIVRVHHEFPAMSFPQIGRVFGIDHTSVMAALEKAGAKLTPAVRRGNFAFRRASEAK